MSVEIEYSPSYLPNTIKNSKEWALMGFVSGSFLISETDYKSFFEIDENKFDSIDKNSNVKINVKFNCKEIEITFPFRERGELSFTCLCVIPPLSYLRFFRNKNCYINLAVIDESCDELIEHIKCIKN